MMIALGRVEVTIHLNANGSVVFVWKAVKAFCWNLESAIRPLSTSQKTMIVSKVSSNWNCFDIFIQPKYYDRNEAYWGNHQTGSAEKLGPITLLMDEISTPISIVCGLLHKPIQINHVLNFWQTVWIAKDAFTDSDKFSTSWSCLMAPLFQNW